MQEVPDACGGRHNLTGQRLLQIWAARQSCSPMNEKKRAARNTSDDRVGGSDGSQVWVEPVGAVIVARLRGIPTAELIRDCQDRVVALNRDTGINLIMYDALEFERPPIDLVLKQQVLTGNLKKSGAKIAIVVPNTSIAYLARLAFGEANHRVFYNDISAAVLWLSERNAEREPI